MPSCHVHFDGKSGLIQTRSPLCCVSFPTDLVGDKLPKEFIGESGVLFPLLPLSFIGQVIGSDVDFVDMLLQKILFSSILGLRSIALLVCSGLFRTLPVRGLMWKVVITFGRIFYWTSSQMWHLSNSRIKYFETASQINFLFWEINVCKPAWSKMAAERNVTKHDL